MSRVSFTCQQEPTLPPIWEGRRVHDRERRGGRQVFGQEEDAREHQVHRRARKVANHSRLHPAQVHLQYLLFNLSGIALLVLRANFVPSRTFRTAKNCLVTPKKTFKWDGLLRNWDQYIKPGNLEMEDIVLGTKFPLFFRCCEQLLVGRRKQPISDQAEDLECLCHLMKTCGKLLDTPIAKVIISNLKPNHTEQILMIWS